MAFQFFTIPRRVTLPMFKSLCLLTSGIALVTALNIAPAGASGIFGTMSNFDVFYSEDPSINAYGSELELEGIHSTDVTTTYPSHFTNITKTDYSNGATFGARITFSGYNFNPPNPFIAYTASPQSTNGHACVNTQGCEHFGFAVGAQPTTTRFFWLKQDSTRINTIPLAVPNAQWTYVPPAVPGNPPVIQAVVRVPEPVEVQPQQPDAVWMKVYETELDREVNLEELLSDGDPAVVPEDAAEVETEWELLIPGNDSMADGPLGNGKDAVIRRYEFFKYTGPYSGEHEPRSTYTGVGDPPVGELGDFIAANMVAVNLIPPIAEPSTGIFLLIAIGIVGSRVRRLGGRTSA